MADNKNLENLAKTFEQSLKPFMNGLVGIVEDAKKNATPEQKGEIDRALKEVNKINDVEMPKTFEGINKMFEDIGNIQNKG